MDSPFNHVLHTNHVPSDAEARQIRDFISEPLINLARIESEISRFQALIGELSIERDKLKQRIDVHRALLSPLRRFPPELMQRIFFRCCPSSRNPVMHTPEAPVLLGRVCSKWRRISLETPQLWSSIHIVVHSNQDATGEALSLLQLKRESIDMWLARSGVCPLTISFYAPESTEWSERASVLLNILILHSRRWKIMDLRVPSRQLAEFAHLTPDDVPILENFAINQVSTHISEWAKHLTFLESAPHLRSLSLSFSRGRTQLPAFPWAHLVDLRLVSSCYFFFLNNHRLLAILRQCPNLRTCTPNAPPSNPSCEPHPENLGEPIRLLYLHTFSVSADDIPTIGVTVEGILNHLILPKLREIEIKGNFYGPSGFNPQTLVAFAGLLSRSSCPLEKLVLHPSVEPPETLIECLRNVPTLTQLIINDWYGGDGRNTYFTVCDNLIQLLTPTHESSAQYLCPNLETIKFQQCYTLSDRVLLNFLNSRWQSIPSGVARLKSVKISFLREVELGNTESEIQILRDRGLDITATFLEHQVFKASPWEGLTKSL